ncbi:MAG: tetratricopeptide repeat protein [Proteobacteria bacterium]|nr:tetratricopeptide repeat protein [Pseudomonadota bacterium]
MAEEEPADHPSLPGRLTAKDAFAKAMEDYRAGRHGDAARLFEALVEAVPEHAAACENLGVARQALGDAAGAEEAYRKAAEIDPRNASPHFNLGTLLGALLRTEEAVECYRAAVERDPGHASALNNLGIALCDLGRYDEAQVAISRAIATKPDHPAAHMQLGVLRLLRGDFLAGWSSYEWRWRTRPFLGEARRYPQPMWDGGPLEGRRILLHSEQGIGDTIQFLRYAPLVAQRGGEVVLEVPPALLPLAESLAKGPGGVAELIARGAAPPPGIDCRAPLMSLGRLFRTTIDSVPAGVPYLLAPKNLPPPALPPAAGQRRIGLVWAGNPRHRTDARRSIPPGLFARLRAISGIRFVSLQRDRPRRRLPSPAPCRSTTQRPC